LWKTSVLLKFSKDPQAWKAQPEKVVLLVLPHARVPPCQVAELLLVAGIVVVVLLLLGGHHEQLGFYF